MTSEPISSLRSDVTGLRSGCVDYLEVFLMVLVIVGYLGLWLDLPLADLSNAGFMLLFPWLLFVPMFLHLCKQAFD